MKQIAPAVGPTTIILPILNGMAHLNLLNASYAVNRVLGGASYISATLDVRGRVVHTPTPRDHLTFGEISGGSGKRTRALTAFFDGADFNAEASDTMMQAMWEKWVVLATSAAITCMMRASIGTLLQLRAEGKPSRGCSANAVRWQPLVASHLSSFSRILHDRGYNGWVAVEGVDAARH